MVTVGMLRALHLMAIYTSSKALFRPDMRAFHSITVSLGLTCVRTRGDVFGSQDLPLSRDVFQRLDQFILRSLNHVQTVHLSARAPSSEISRNSCHY